MKLHYTRNDGPVRKGQLLLIDTVQALKRVTDLPELALEPEVALVTGAQGEQIMWVSIEGSASLDERWDMVDEVIQPALLRVKGVGEVIETIQ